MVHGRVGSAQMVMGLTPHNQTAEVKLFVKAGKVGQLLTCQDKTG